MLGQDHASLLIFTFNLWLLDFNVFLMNANLEIVFQGKIAYSRFLQFILNYVDHAIKISQVKLDLSTKVI